ncbi:hypothetical protein IWX46DRAFT_607192 [Phyllosticta citricarpa]|uniref:NAD-dependent epimerase/dehydratase domain-containing protein n=1 Tax=Phyllosticta citricarpa TaxID=55181 RepID=A0ABR1LYK9_9PEZI
MAPAPPIDNPVLPPGSTILVTGVNGLIGSVVADVLLAHGYKVRGSVRDTAKHAWMTAHFDQKHGAGRFELVHVANISAPGAFDAAMQDVAGVAHVAALLNQDPDPNNVIPPSLETINGVLESAAKTPSVKRFVLTSTAMTVRDVGAKDPAVVTQESWNEASVERAWRPPPYEPERGLEVYGAAKVVTEKAMWKFVEERKPGFVCNSGEYPLCWFDALPWLTIGFCCLEQCCLHSPLDVCLAQSTRARRRPPSLSLRSSRATRKSWPT